MLFTCTHTDNNSEVAILPRVPGFSLRQTTSVVLCGLAMLSFGSCDKVPLLAPSNSIITLFSSRTILPINGTAQITATVIEQSGTPAHNGTLVTFTSSLGTLDPREAVTSNGQAVVTLHAGTESGVATVTAFSGSAQSTGSTGPDGTTTTSSTLTVTIGGAASASISLTATPGSVSPRGGTVTVVASVADVNGNLLPGVPVSFSVSAGSLGTASVLTDANGQATTTVTTDRETVVTATSGPQTATTTIQVDTLPAVTIVATPMASSVDEPVTFAVTVRPGSSAIADVSIDFGDGSSQALGALAGPTSVSHTYKVAGSFIVTVTVRDTSNATVEVVTVIAIESPAPLNVTIASPATVQVNVAAIFTATATQSTPGILEIARYEWEFGDGTNVTTTGSSTSHVFANPGVKVVTVRAVEKDGRSGTGQAQINVTPVTPLNVVLTASPSAPVEDESVTFVANATGSAVPVASYAWNFGDGTTVTTSGNQVTHVYTDPGTFTVKVTAVTSEGVSGSAQISVVVSPTVFSVNLTFSPPRPDEATQVTFTATVSPPTLVVNRYDFAFGDGESVTGSANSVQHVFTVDMGETTSTFTVTVTAFRALGNESTSSQVTVTVSK